MSAIETGLNDVHKIVPFVSGKSEAFAGQRLAKITFKTQKDGTKLSESVCVSVPWLSAEEIGEVLNSSEFQAVAQGLIESAQNELIRAKHLAGKTSVATGDIGSAALIAYYAAEQSGSRLSEESLKAWFDSELADSVTSSILEKLGIAGEEELTESVAKKLEQTLTALRGLIAGLAAKTVFYTEKQLDTASRILGMAQEDSVAKRLVAKIAAIKLGQAGQNDALDMI